MTITCGRALSLASFPSSSVGRYSSSLGIPSTTKSGVRSSTRPGALSTTGTVSVRHELNSRGNTVTGVEGVLLGVVKDLRLQYTLYVYPLPNPVGLRSEVHRVWSRPQDKITDAGYIERLSKNIGLVSPRLQRQSVLHQLRKLRQKHSGARGQFVYYIKNHIKELLGLPGDPTTITHRVQYLPEDDRFMCPSNWYDVCILLSPCRPTRTSNHN